MKNFMRVIKFRTTIMLFEEKEEVGIEHMISEPLSPNVVMMILPQKTEYQTKEEDFELFLCHVDPLLGMGPNKIKLADLRTQKTKIKSREKQEPWLVGQLNEKVDLAVFLDDVDRICAEITYDDLYFIEKVNSEKTSIENSHVHFPKAIKEAVSKDKECMPF